MVDRGSSIVDSANDLREELGADLKQKEGLRALILNVFGDELSKDPTDEEIVGFVGEQVFNHRFSLDDGWGEGETVISTLESMYEELKAWHEERSK